MMRVPRLKGISFVRVIIINIFIICVIIGMFLFDMVNSDTFFFIIACVLFGIINIASILGRKVLFGYIELHETGIKVTYLKKVLNEILWKDLKTLQVIGRNIILFSIVDINDETTFNKDIMFYVTTKNLKKLIFFFPYIKVQVKGIQFLSYRFQQAFNSLNKQ